MNEFIAITTIITIIERYHLSIKRIVINYNKNR
jgi:hypothetical protein